MSFPPVNWSEGTKLNCGIVFGVSSPFSPTGADFFGLREREKEREREGERERVCGVFSCKPCLNRKLKMKGWEKMWKSGKDVPQKLEQERKKRDEQHWKTKEETRNEDGVEQRGMLMMLFFLLCFVHFCFVFFFKLWTFHLPFFKPVFFQLLLKDCYVISFVCLLE